jgi:signal transduction histidine kinase/ActR/RegA family two-component response regulator
LTRLWIIVAIAVLPALAFQAYSVFDAHRVRQQLVQDEVLRLLHLVTAEQRRIQEGAEQVLDVIASSPSVQDGNPADCKRLLAALLKRSPRYSYADVAAPDGSALCIPGPRPFPFDATTRTHFRDALAGNGMVVGDYGVGTMTGRPTIHLAKAVRNEAGAVIGVVEVALSLDWLGQQLAQLDLPAGSIVSISDRNGVFLARYPTGVGYVGRPHGQDRHFLVEGNTIRLIDSMTSLDGDHPMVAAVSPPSLDPKGFTIAVALERETAFGSIARANQAGLVLMAASALLALGLTGWLGIRLIRRPVDRLLAVAAAWRAGNLSARTGLRGRANEFGELAGAFEDMADALEAREQALHQALESTTDIVVVVDRNWRITYLNRHARKNAEGRDAVGQDFWEAYPTVIGTSFERGYRQAMETGLPTTVEDYYPRLEGHFEASIYPTARGLTMFIRDLTEERRIAAALRESESRLQLARTAAGFGVFDRDFVTGVLIWSDEQWRLHGLEPHADGPSETLWIASIHPADRERMLARKRAAAADVGGAPFRTEYRSVWPDGSVHWLQIMPHFTRGSTGRPLRVVGVTIDVTASREREAALRQFSSELERRVQQEVAAREAAQLRAAQAERMQALGQLAGGIAHDINNVLQAASGALTLIQRRPGNEAGVLRLAKLGSDSIARGASITRRLLAFGRRGDLRAEPLDVAGLLGGVQEILNYTLGAGIEVVTELPDDLPPVAADKGQLETALVNLATNARDAMPNGGRIVFSAEREVVAVGVLAHPAGLSPGRYVRFDVVDSGQGMDAETLARAREPFFTTKKAGAGTGLGLPMAFGFAEQSGGGLAIDSRVGQGTTVSLWLPESEGTPCCTDTTPARAEPRGRAARVLVVDDEDAVREVLSRYLEDAGYLVLRASSGAEALSLLAARRDVDALLTDLSMPGMDGLALIRSAQDRRPDLPAILLTGFAEDAAALALGVTIAGRISLLRKPVSDTALLDHLDTMLAARSVEAV